MKNDKYRVRRNDGLWPRNDLTREGFLSLVWDEGADHYRELPWRGISDAYAVLVSEVMLQQTQVSRVEKYWQSFLETFPTLSALADASVAEVLTSWQGLGYNRRALALKRTAEQVVSEHSGMLPHTFDELVSLPGIGPATAAGVMAFAYEKPVVYIETNVRSVFIHELFPDETAVSDADLIPFVADTVSTTDPRGWYYALLDYGASLKKDGRNPTRASTSYTRQSKFEGSRRQKRAELIRILIEASSGVERSKVKQQLDAIEETGGRESVDNVLFDELLTELYQEGFISIDDGKISIA